KPSPVHHPGGQQRSPRRRHLRRPEAHAARDLLRLGVHPRGWKKFRRYRQRTLSKVALASGYLTGLFGSCMEEVRIPGENSLAFIEHRLRVARPAEIAINIRQ